MTKNKDVFPESGHLDQDRVATLSRLVGISVSPAESILYLTPMTVELIVGPTPAALETSLKGGVVPISGQLYIIPACIDHDTSGL